jgi:hypothetical protein
MTNKKAKVIVAVALSGLALLIALKDQSSQVQDLGFDAFRNTDTRIQQSRSSKQSEALPLKESAESSEQAKADWISEVQLSYRNDCGDLAQVEGDLKEVQKSIATLSDDIRAALRRQEKIPQETFDRLAQVERQESRLTLIQTLCAADQLRAHLEKQSDQQQKKKETSNVHES